MEEAKEFTTESQSRSLEVHPSSAGLGTTSEPVSSDGSPGSVLAATKAAAAVAAHFAASAASSSAKAAALCAKPSAPLPGFTEPSSDSLGSTCLAPHQIGHGNLSFPPTYVACIAQDPCTTTDLSSSFGPVTMSSLGPVTTSSLDPITMSSLDPVTTSSSGPEPCSVPDTSPCYATVPGPPPGPICDPTPGPVCDPTPAPTCVPSPGPICVPSPGPVCDPAPGPTSGSVHESGSGLGLSPGAEPECSPGPEPSPTPPENICLEPDSPSEYTTWYHRYYQEPQKQQPWKFLQVSEPGAQGLQEPKRVEGKSALGYKTLTRGRCLLYNWEEERATNHLDQVPCSQDGSESFFFRHGHQGLLTMHLQSPMPSSTTQRDSYQPPRKPCQPLQGKREAMLEMHLYHHICNEVQAEQEPERKLFEVESVTHHDYGVKLVQAKPPAPTKPHDYRKEQPETFWLQRASKIPGVSNIRTLDTPFRKNCSFSTPLPLSLGDPLPYEPGSYPQQLGTMSFLACQGSGLGCQNGKTTP
ncbi:sperm-associated antigen 8 [Perognathus longimembris pacificus]|uniref:sperm-associated antigen 8 n=1 Tax=Perognathus longimembris pacificus TaxID=214514 RepID=UPI0020190181|nr:sperm-associated antigen 8 [Perognathus longimembris pacificus]